MVKSAHGVRGLIRELLSLDRKVAAVLITVPVVLTGLQYYGMPWHYMRGTQGRRDHLSPPLGEWLGNLRLPGPESVQPFIWWGIAVALLLILIPMAVGLAVGMGPRRLGLRLKGTGGDGWTYLLLYLIFAPVIFVASRGTEFQATYPFFKPRGDGLGAGFLLFEAFYCLQFLAVEFFFRGFIVLGLKPRLGSAAVLVMLAPYCMVHYYKPFPEAMGAIGAGLILGALAYRTGTIVYGWFLHYGVALTMDLLALHHKGLL